ncbi:alpha-amylase family protein [Pseudonocardia sp. MH-G8]|uniref:alpha-amylase family protein n=1 Tax=Pseudonocardia sp. MH-G8 TaxID=1854588 RepID=UPI000B9FB4FA|nr:alpha-amylase family protein [Pseudonocardia sp. MH-G8]OZM82099.1 hypothetical protein CFP66_09805 [Pseudonocardia sp. MH-G8]
MGLWWHEPFRTFQTNLREIDAGLDVERVLDRIEEFGANAWLLSVGGIVSNYPTDLPSQTRNPALAQRGSGDLVGDAVAAAHARGIRLLARMDFSKVDRRRAEEHPEWCFVDPAGEWQVYNGLTSVCPSAPYYQRESCAVVEEVLSRYDVDGFFFNWASYNERDYSARYRGVCQCLSCVRAFDAALPSGPDDPGYPVWRRFAKRMVDDICARMRELIAARRPEAPLIMGDTADIVFHEANNQVGRPLWHHRTSEHVSAARTFRPRVPVFTNAVGFVDMPYRLAGEEPEHMAQYLVQAISRGANPSTYVMGTPDDSRYECLDVAGQITRHHRDHEEVYADLVPAARVVLVRPDLLGPAPDVAEFQGLYRALLERHVPFDVLGEERLGACDRLGDYAVAVLPDLGVLRPAAVAALDAFTGAGGVVVGTGSSGFDGAEAQLAGSPVAERPAVRDTVEAVRSMHLLPDAEPAFPVPVIGAYHVVTPADGARTGMRVLSRAPYGPPEKCHGHVELAQPGVLVADRVTVLPWTPGRAYREVGLSAHRDLVVDAVVTAAPVPVAVETDLPDQVEVVLGRSRAGLVAHLVNLTGAGPQRFGPPVTVHGARMWVSWADPGARVRAVRAGVDLPVTVRDGRPGVDLPPLELFEVLVLTEEAS